MHISDSQPVPIAALTRVQVLARSRALGRAIDLLRDQQWRDPGEGYRCIGKMKQELLALEMDIWRRDQAERDAEREAVA